MQRGELTLNVRVENLPFLRAPAVCFLIRVMREGQLVVRFVDRGVARIVLHPNVVVCLFECSVRRNIQQFPRSVAKHVFTCLRTIDASENPLQLADSI